MKVLLLFFLFATSGTYAQTCDCPANFLWMKKTFEENDAGFRYVIDKKGQEAYEYHNQSILKKMAEAKSYEACRGTMRSWLDFFRKFHLSISLTDSVQKLLDAVQEAELQEAFKKVPAATIKKHERIKLEDKYWNNYLKNIKEPGFEGLWFFPPFYKVAIIKNGQQYAGYILDGPPTAPMQKGSLKLIIYPVKDGYKSTIYSGILKRFDSAAVTRHGNESMHVGNFYFEKLDPLYPDSPIKTMYNSFLQSRTPLLARLSSNTIYLRLPGFNISQKRAIDSLLEDNDTLIKSATNLIIDIRGNGGGADDSYSGLIKYLYTNPIRNVGVEMYSTPLNNKRFLDYAKNPNFSEERRKDFLQEYELLKRTPEKFVLLNKKGVSINTRDTVYPYPRKVAILMNGSTGSSAEQLLVDAKQSTKVKLFGTSTLGSLDMSNMTEAVSPSNEFVLTYATTKSLRLPGFTIDASGIQPDYFIDKSVPVIEWIPFVQNILELGN